MTSVKCGWCDTHSHMTKLGKDVDVTQDPEDAWKVQQAHTCDNCNCINIATIYNTGDYGSTGSETTHIDTEQGTICFEWFPRFPQQGHYPHVPEHIAAAAAEASLCLSAGAHRAVGSLARAVVEATGKQQGHKMHGIKTKIDAMAAAGTLRPLVVEQAQEIQQFGNDMAHGDFLTPTTKEEAAEIIALMDEILREVYQAPAELDRVKKAREKKKTDEEAKRQKGWET